MARRLSKNDNIVWSELIEQKRRMSIPEIANSVALTEVKVLVSLKKLLAHGVVRVEKHLYWNL